MPEFELGDAIIEVPEGASQAQIQAAVAAFRSRPEFDALVDKRRGAPADVRMTVGGAPIADRLANLRRFYPDAQPYRDDNFVFTDPDTGRPTLYNPTGFDAGDVASVGRELSQAAGGTLGATAGTLFAGPGVGTVAGAGAGTALGGELFDIAMQVGAGQVRSEGVFGNLLDIALDFAAGAAGQRGGELVSAGVKRAIGGGTEAAKRLVESFKALAIEPPAGAVTGSRTVATAEKALEAGTFSGDVLQKQAETVLAQTKAAAERVAATMARPRTVQGAGETIRRAAVGAAERFGFTQERAYTEAFDLVGAETPVRTRAVVELLNNLATELSRSPRALGPTLRPGIDMLKAIYEDGAVAGGIPFAALREIRTNVGRDIAQPLLSGSSGARNEVLKRIYAALTEDMSAAAKAAGPDAAKKLAVADRFTRQWMNTAARTMEKINRFEGDERAFNFAFQSGRDGGTALARLRRNFLPEEWDTVSASVLARLGKATPGAQDATGEAFSVSTFLTNWNRLAPEAKTALFGGDRYKALRAGLDDLVAVIGSLKGVEKVANTSNTARSMIAWSTIQTLGGALGGLTIGGDPQSAVIGALGVAVAPRVAARLIVSPAFVRWLTTPVTRANGLGPHLARLAAIAAEEPLIKDEIDQYLTALRAVGSQEAPGSTTSPGVPGVAEGGRVANPDGRGAADTRSSAR